jgi:hypothetical protein
MPPGAVNAHVENLELLMPVLSDLLYRAKTR